MFVLQSSICLDEPAVVPMISPEHPALPPATLSPGPLSPPTPMQASSPDVEQAWMELLSLPELQVRHMDSLASVLRWFALEFAGTINQRMHQ